MESEKYSVYTRVGTSNPPLLVVLESSTGPARVARQINERRFFKPEENNLHS